MAEIIVTRGLPASGKSTWANAWVAEDPDNRVRVNRDDLRHMLFGKYFGVDEVAVSKAEEALVVAALKAGKDVVIDATHLKAAYVKKWTKYGTVSTQEFAVPVETCVAQDYWRAEDGGRSVGADVIWSIAKRYHVKEDGTLPKVTLGDLKPVEFKPYIPGPIPAYCFDIDGTLAHMTDRGPYDTSRYHTDAPDRSLTETLWSLQQWALKYRPNMQFIGLSGRNADHAEATHAWLEGDGIYLDYLFMRPSGDFRNDAIVKSELVDEHISGVYDVIMHFDDRNRVVDALRAKGMKVAQVAPGDF